ncbi:MAG: hypothetical protein NVS2B12_28800 [Ktedonobacteraceae bacterium]
MPPTKAAAESKPRRTVGGILSVIAVVILAPLIGILITTAITGTGRSTTQASQTSPASKTNNTSQQAAATPAGSTSNQNPVLPTPTSFKTAKDTNVNISLQYPADWTQSSPRQSTNATSFNVSQDQIGINFFVTHFNDSISSSINNADELNQSNIQELTQVLNASNVRNVQVANQQPSIAGAKWIEKDATFTDTANNKMRFSTISVQHGKSYYVIYFFIPDGIYTEAMQKYIMPMLNSVKFLS